MISLPIIFRELLVSSRRKRTFILRVVFGLFVAGVAVMFLLGQMLSRSQAVGHGLLTSFAWQMTILVFILTPAVTCGCISDERRQGTLGLLFLTRLNSADIILGKFVGRTFDIVLVVLSAAPLLFVPILLGGVGWDQTLSVLVCVCSTVLLTSSVAVFCSTLIANTGTATLMSYIGLFAYNVAALVLPQLKRASFSTPFLATAVQAVPDWLKLASPFFALSTENLRSSLSTLLICGIAGSVLLAISIAYLPLLVRTSGFREPAWRRFRRSSVAAGQPRIARVVDRAVLDRDPLFWLFYRRRKNHWLLQLVLGGLLVLCIGYEWYVNVNDREGLYALLFFGGLFVAFLLKILMVINAARSFASEKEDGSLELMLAMPFTNQQVVKARLLAVLGKYGIVYGIVFLLVIGSGLGLLTSMPGESMVGFLFGCYFVGTTITGLSWAVCVSALISVWSKSVRQALTLSILLVLLVSWGIWQLTYLGVLFAGLFGMFAQLNFPNNNATTYGMGALFVSARMAIDLLIAYVAYRSLTSKLRKHAAR